ncbi:dual specificity protein phosphatase family protein [Shimia sp. R10_1]|uniref:protein-tyrosine phosphatase family protein n=1 Tax=Shimia sp. R10_1 TaxID=2821095 RepID=UPI001ADAD68A|nr:dual specificity protein phosphatase family protein [Shimia sp. R10_1]MBO9474529.1 dual specificity protein phosphatase family protein [Shimia sp. R10_1]
MTQEFKIYPCAVSDGQLALSPAPGAARPLAEALEAISNWGAQHVVSLTEESEMMALGMQSLGDGLTRLGIHWIHVPIADFDIPNAAQTERWAVIEAQLLQALKAGERVLVHCRGGCGRSGMMVLKLMMAVGEAPEGALARLRAIRRCAVETDAQMSWATGGLIQTV